MEQKSKISKAISKYRKEIIGGLIVSAIWFLIECLLKNAPEVGKTIIGQFLNLVFMRAARISSESLLSSIIAFFAAFIFAIALIPYIIRKIDKKQKNEMDKFNNQADKYDAQIKTVTANIEEYMKNPEENIDEIDACLGEIKKIDEEIKLLKSQVEKKHKHKILPTILGIFIFIFTYITEIIPISLLNDFNRDIKMIKPYTDNKTVLLLESDWTRMKSKDDYDKIYETIDKIKEEHNLPK